MADKVYFVKSYNEDGITLRQFMFRFIEVYIPRSSIASIRGGAGLSSIETTGHRSYRVNAGFKKHQQLLTVAALANDPDFNKATADAVAQG